MLISAFICFNFFLYVSYKSKILLKFSNNNNKNSTSLVNKLCKKKKCNNGNQGVQHSMKL